MMDNNKHTMHDQLLVKRRERTPVKPMTLARLQTRVRQHNSLQDSSARNPPQLSTEHILVKNNKFNQPRAMVNLHTDSQRMVEPKDTQPVVPQQLMDNSNRRHPMAEQLLEEDTRLLSKDMLLVVWLQSPNLWASWDSAAARNNKPGKLLPRVHLCS